MLLISPRMKMRGAAVAFTVTRAAMPVMVTIEAAVPNAAGDRGRKLAARSGIRLPAAIRIRDEGQFVLKVLPACAAFFRARKQVEKSRTVRPSGARVQQAVPLRGRFD